MTAAGWFYVQDDKRLGPVDVDHIVHLVVTAALAPSALVWHHGLAEWTDEFPLLDAITLKRPETIGPIAELGITMMMFMIGLELSLDRLRVMRRLVFGLGSLQIVLSAAAIGAAVILAGGKPPVPLIVGACLALSSTAIVVDVLSRQRRLNTSAGRASAVRRRQSDAGPRGAARRCSP